MSDNALADLIGIDPEQLKGLLASLGPTPEMQAQADKQKWLTTGLGILAARPGNTWNAVGQGGLLGVQAGQQSLQQQLAQRGQDLSQVMQLRQAQMQSDYMKKVGAILNGGGDQTTAGPPQSFQSLGGAAGQMQSGITGQPPSINALPTRVPLDQTSIRDKLARLNLQGVGVGMKDLSPALNAAFPLGIAARAGAPIIDPATGRVINANAAPPKGFYYDPAQNRFVPVAGGQDAIATSEATPKAVGLAYEPQLGTLSSGGQGVVGNKLSALFGDGQLPYGAQRPFANASPTGQFAGATPNAAQSGPVQTELSPEQRKASEAGGEYRDEVRKAAESANAGMGVVNQLEGYAKNINFGATAPWRLEVGRNLYDIPKVGSSLASAFVPNADVQIPAMQAYNKLAFGLVAKQTRDLGPREAVQAMQMVQSSNPNIQLTEGGNNALLHQIRGTHQWALDREQFMQQWLADPAHHNSVNGFQEWLNKEHPYSDYVPPLSDLQLALQGKDPKAATAASQSGNSNVVQLPDGRQKVFPNAQAAAAFRKAAGL